MAAIDAVGTPKQKSNSKFQVQGKESLLTVGVTQFWRWALFLMVIGSITAMWILLTGVGSCPSNEFKSSLVENSAFRKMFDNIQQQELAYSLDPQCNGKRIFIQELPPQFNSEILEKFCSDELAFIHKCGSYTNGGAGGALEGYMEPVKNWYKTEHYSLEILFHERLKHYKCRTMNPELADLFYLPYYTGLDLKQHLHHDQMQLTDFLVQRLLGWLLRDPAWTKSQGNNHFMVVGRPVWDHMRPVQYPGWGNSFLTSHEIWNLTKLVVERDPDTADPRQLAIPYPTSLHPTSDSDIRMWQKKVAASTRDLFVAYTGGPRNVTLAPKMIIRQILYEQCTESDRCKTLMCDKMDCRRNPEVINDFFLSATFCLQPPGDSATRKSVFDCLVAGSIPVLFNPHTAYTQFTWHLPSDSSSYSVFINQTELMAHPFSVIDQLAAIPDVKVKQMQKVIWEVILPSIVYDDPGRDSNKTIMDAFDITLEHILDPTFRSSTSGKGSIS